VAISNTPQKKVVIIGAGFAGLACARKLAKNKSLHITILDKNNYHQFQPLLYQVAACILAVEDIIYPIRKLFANNIHVDIKKTEVVSADLNTKTVACKDGQSYHWDYLVIAAGSQVNFFNIPGASQYAFPLYSINDAHRLRTRILTALEDANRDQSLIEKGALNFVVVGAGPTGTEMAGGFADMIKEVLPAEYHDMDISKACIYMINNSPTILEGFSKKSQEYAKSKLKKKGVILKLNTAVTEIGAGHVLLSDGTKILSRTVVWAGGLKAAPIAAQIGIAQGRGGRIDVEPNLTVKGYPNIYVLGDLANIAKPGDGHYPQLGSVAKQSGQWAARNILEDLNSRPTLPFKYHDRGIMAMIGRNAAVAELGVNRFQIQGFIAFFAWLGVHAALLPSLWQTLNASIQWTYDYFGRQREVQVIDQEDSQINWQEDP